MKAIIQRVSKAQVEVDANIVGKINDGIVVFIGFTHTDTELHVEWFSNKLIHLRLFEDEHGKTNCSLIDQKGSVLIVSQFTLYADCNTGRRPSFTTAASPEIANHLYNSTVKSLREKGVTVETGVFGAKMKVSLVNEGPMTLILER